MMSPTGKTSIGSRNSIADVKQFHTPLTGDDSVVDVAADVAVAVDVAVIFVVVVFFNDRNICSLTKFISFLADTGVPTDAP